MKFAIMFPGQGSQKVGMGLDLYEKNSLAKEIFSLVNNIVGRNISDVFLHGPQEELNQTRNTQISIVTISVVLSMLLQEKTKERNFDFNPIACCGHSLGELTALWYLNVLELEDLLKLVSIRGELMQNAPSGSMAAILNLSTEQIEKLIENAIELKDKVVIANYNSPNQTVVSGNKEAFEKGKLPELVKQIGGKAIILPVSGAFHSPLMADPANRFNLELDKAIKHELTPLNTYIYQNYDGLPSNNYAIIKEKIKKQMTSPVYWTQTINNLVKDNVTNIVEIGPGKVLTGLVQKINPNLECFNVYDLESLENFINVYESKLLKFSKTT